MPNSPSGPTTALQQDDTAVSTSRSTTSVRSQGRGARAANLRNYLLAFVLLAPNLILLTIFVYRPLIDNFRISFTDWNISGKTYNYIGFDNYVRWFNHSDTWIIVKNTVIFTSAAVFGSMFLGFALAMLLDQKILGRNFMRTVIFAPFVISGAAIGVAFQFVFDPTFGLLTDILTRLGLTTPRFYQDDNWALFMITVTYIWKNLGYSFVIYLAALQGRRKDLDEAAEIDGASYFTHLFRVLLPQIRPTTFFLLITVMLNSMQVFDIINVMTRGGPLEIGTTTMVYQIYLETFNRAQAGYGATVASILFLILLLITVIQVTIMNKGQES